MSDKELEALAQTLCALYWEALGWVMSSEKWTQIAPKDREAWIQVAEFVAERDNIEIPDHR